MSITHNGYIENGYNPSRNTSNNLNIKSIIEWGGKLISLIILPLLLWMITLLISLDKRVAIIERDEFSSSDAIKMVQDISTLQRDLIKANQQIFDLQQCQIKLRIGKANDC